jgi:GNAT superfamily N-acetyltransferase
MIELRVLGAGDGGILRNVADGVFDFAVEPHLTAEFLADPRHHLVVAVDQGLVVGMASAVHYVHPDKPPELWINEVGVAPTHRCQGIAKALLRSLLDVGRHLNCREAWVLTDRSNPAAMRVYETAGGLKNSQDQVMFEFRLDAQGTSH